MLIGHLLASTITETHPSALLDTRSINAIQCWRWLYMPYRDFWHGTKAIRLMNKPFYRQRCTTHLSRLNLGAETTFPSAFDEASNLLKSHYKLKIKPGRDF